MLCRDFAILTPLLGAVVTRDGGGRVFGSTEVNIENWKPLVRLVGHTSDVTDLAWSRDDTMLASVGLDVYPDEPNVNPRLLEFPNITLLPHMGTETRDSQKKMEVRALTNLRDYLTKGAGADLVWEFK